MVNICADNYVYSIKFIIIDQCNARLVGANTGVGLKDYCATILIAFM